MSPPDHVPASWSINETLSPSGDIQDITVQSPAERPRQGQTRGITFGPQADAESRFHLDGNHPAPPVATQSAAEAYTAVLARAGAQRDPVDTRIVSEVRNGIGKRVDSQDEVGAWPDYKATFSPLDTDQDGIPDVWEKSTGLNPADSKDSAQLTPSGYTNLELYLNSRVQD